MHYRTNTDLECLSHYNKMYLGIQFIDQGSFAENNLYQSPLTSYGCEIVMHFNPFTGCLLKF